MRETEEPEIEESVRERGVTEKEGERQRSERDRV